MQIDPINTATSDEFQDLIKKMLIGWSGYPEAWERKYKTPFVQADPESHVAWIHVGNALLELLWGEIGDTDFGLTETYIKNLMALYTKSKGPLG